ncbi:hypothetical protein B9T31_02830 [Acinetobacter sp. ANC 4558]|uniref:hypothetical protein n=1 Tax=Acinetobacter sp. ANC 4558 TaxID=1977876 RepID=UPI000A32E866|nr:hypothetical protein [Acinetobacter sp. ANC 4558]OTG87455.1 hypothetical protein B9T31_02830 [Acinetobacter sp. ANC 4558]
MNSPINALNPEKVITSSRVKKDQHTSLFAYRLMITYRFALALIGGYVLAMLSAVVCAQYFADYRGNAAMSATMIAFTVWTCAFIWVFIVNKTLKASLGIIVPSVILYVLYKFLGN